MVCFKRDEIQALIAAVRDAPADLGDDKKNIILHSEESGLVLRTGASDKCAPAQLIDYNQIDPVIGWDVSKAKLTPSVQLVPVGLFAIIMPPVLTSGIEKSKDKVYAFFLLFRGAVEGCIGQFSLRGLEYNRLDDDEYKARCEPAVWPPAEIPPASFEAGFIPDQMAHMCEVIRNEKHAARGEPEDKFLCAGKQPEVGMYVYLHVVLDPKKVTGKPYTRLIGRITEVDPLPPEDAPVDPLIGESYFKHCKCGKPHPRSEILKQLGTIHGAKVRAVVYVAPDQLNDAPAEWVGQWNAVLVANDALQALWHLYGLGARPRAEWVEQVPRVY